MKRYKTQALISEINITPFTDVILVLLIIFMIATPLIFQSGIEVKLPQATSKNADEDSKQVNIKITSEGVVYFENKVINNKGLKKEVESMLSKDSNLKVNMAADKDCRFQEVVRVMDIMKEAGVKNLNIVTKTNE